MSKFSLIYHVEGIVRAKHVGGSLASYLSLSHRRRKKKLETRETRVFSWRRTPAAHTAIFSARTDTQTSSTQGFLYRARTHARTPLHPRAHNALHNLPARPRARTTWKANRSPSCSPLLSQPLGRGNAPAYCARTYTRTHAPHAHIHAAVYFANKTNKVHT
jgi:hypothetical protein